MLLRLVFATVFALQFAGSASFAAEVVVQNDSAIGGTPSTVANLFISGESAASWLTATCNGDTVAMQVYWASQFGGAPAQLEQALTLFSAGTFPTPAAALASIPGPTPSDGVVNEFRFLDPPTNFVPLQIPSRRGRYSSYRCSS